MYVWVWGWVFGLGLGDTRRCDWEGMGFGMPCPALPWVHAIDGISRELYRFHRREREPSVAVFPFPAIWFISTWQTKV